VGVDVDLDGVTTFDLQPSTTSMKCGDLSGIFNGAVPVHVKVHDYGYGYVKVNGSSVESMV